MRFAKRIVAGIILFLSLSLFLLSLAGGLGVWIAKNPVITTTNWLLERIDGKLELADQGLQHVNTGLARAADRLEEVRQEQRKLAQEPRSNNALGGFLARTVQQSLVPEFTNAHETFHKVADAALVIHTILEDLVYLPLFSVAGLEVGDLSGINRSLSQVESSALMLGRLLSQPGPDTDSSEPGVQLSRIEQTLKTTRELLAGYAFQFNQVRQQTDQIKSRLRFWLTPTVILLSGVLFWIALSQVSLMVHTLSWWRSLSRGIPS